MQQQPYVELTEREQQWMAALRGCLCHKHEWLAAGAIGDSHTIIGLCRLPHDGEPMVVRFTDGQRGWTAFYAVQQLIPGLYRCLISGAIFEWPDEQVKVYSALSRLGGGIRLDTTTWSASVEE
jgi:hypothetical protein